MTLANYKKIIKTSRAFEMKLFFLVLLFLVPASASATQVWNSNDWTSYVNVVIPADNISETLTDFPVYVDLSDLGDAFWSGVNDGGTDIRVVNSYGVELPREVVSASTTLKTGELHFKADTLSSVSHSVFRIYYNGTTTADYTASSTYGAENVWTNNFTAVYHFEEDGSVTDYVDSTSNGNDGTPQNIDSADKISGVLGSGVNNDGTTEGVLIPDDDSFNWTEGSVSGWLQTDTVTTDGTLAARGADGSADILLWFDEGIDDVGCAMTIGGSFYNGTSGGSYTTRSTGEWLHAFCTYDGDSLVNYVNGASNYTNSTPLGSIASAAANGGVGQQSGGGRSLDGRFDEVRFHSTGRSQSWVDAEYLNQASSSEFYSTTTIPGLDISGTVYLDDGVTPAGAGLSVKAGLGTNGQVIIGTTTDSSGNYVVQGIATSTGGAIWHDTGAGGGSKYIAYGDGKFVVMGDMWEGTTDDVYVSSDGESWTNYDVTSEYVLVKSVTYGDGKFVAVADCYVEARKVCVMYSEDGINWATTTASSDEIWSSVTYGNGLFVAIATYNGVDTNVAVMTSPDGINWTGRTGVSGGSWQSVTYGDGLFVVVGIGLGAYVMTSPDGITWTKRTPAASNSWRGVTYGDGKFVAVGEGAMTSSDGITWSGHSVLGNNESLQSVVYGNGYYVAVGYGGDDDEHVAYSTDGINWATSTLPTGLDGRFWRDVGYGENKFLTSDTSNIITSDAGFGDKTRVTLFLGDEAEQASTVILGPGDGVEDISGVDLYQNTVRFDNTHASATVDLADLEFFDSADDSDVLFTATTSTTTINASLEIDSGTTVTAPESLVIAGDFTQNGTIDNSSSTVYFTGPDPEVAGDLVDGNSLENVVVDPSSGGGVWTTRSNQGDGDGWQSVAYGDGLFVAMSEGWGDSDVIMTSPDGITWTARSAAGDDDTWYSVTYANSLYVAVGNGGDGGGEDRVITSPDGITWTARSAVGDDDAWQSVTYGNGIFVAVGNSGDDRVMTSPDGITWTARSAAGDNDSWNSVTYGDGLFVVVGGSGDDRVMTSPDGITWTARSAAGDNDIWYGVTYGKGLFVAVGYCDGVTYTQCVMTSPDGITWTARSAVGDDDVWNSVTYGNSIFVAVGQGGPDDDVIMISLDGINWSTTTSAGDADAWYGVTYGNGLFVAVGNYDDDSVMTSHGALTLTNNTDITNLTTSQYKTLISTSTLDISGNLTNNGNIQNTGSLIISGDDSTINAVATTTASPALGDVTITGSTTLTSSASTTDFTIENGATFTTDQTLSITGDLTQNGDWSVQDSTIKLEGSGQVVEGDLDTDNAFDTLEVEAVLGWAARSAAGDNDDWNSVTYANDLFVAVGQSGDSCVMTSPDGITWSTTTAAGDDDAWSSVTYGNDLFVAVSWYGDNRVMTSPDGINWTARSAAGDNDRWSSVTYGNGLFVAVGNTSGGIYDAVMTSPDGITWTIRSAVGDNDRWSSVTYGNGLFVAVGYLGDRVMTSPDGITWTARSAVGDNDGWQSVTYGNGLFVAVGSNGDNRVMTSPDGINWTVRSAAGDDDSWRSVNYGNSLFVAVSWYGDNRVMTSPDGINWTARSAAGDNDRWSSVTYGSGLFVAVGYDGGYDLVMTADAVDLTTTFLNSASTTDLEIGGGNTLYSTSSISVGGDVTKVGNIDIKNLYLTGSDNIVNAFPSGAVDPSLGNVVVSGAYEIVTAASTSDLTIQSGGEFTAPSTGLTIAGDFVQNGDFDNNGGTIYFTGPDPLVAGDLIDGNKLKDVAVQPSAGGEFWTINNDVSNDDLWQSVVYGDGVFVAVGNVGSGDYAGYGDDVVMTSSDGINWTAYSVSDDDDWWNSVTYANDLFVAVGAAWGDDVVMTSPDGITWTVRSAAGDDDYWQSVTYGNGLFVAVGNDGDERVMTSPDGINWTARSAAGDDDYWNSVTYGNDLFVAVGFAFDSDAVMTSPDGITWTVRSAVDDDDLWTSVTYDNDRFVAVGYVGDGADVVMTSLDGVTWSGHDAGNGWQSVTYGNNIFVAVGNVTADSDRVMTSHGALTLTNNTDITNLTTSQYKTLISTSTLDISGNLTNSGNIQNSGSLIISGDDSAINAVATTTASPALGDVTITGSATLTSSASTTDFTIENGATFTTDQTLSITGDLTQNGDWSVQDSMIKLEGSGQVVEGDLTESNSFGDVAVDAVLVWSTTTITEDVDDDWASVVYANGLFVAVGDSWGDDVLATSPDGINWTVRSAAGDNDIWTSVTYGNGLFVAVGYSAFGGDSVMTSPDGITWTVRSAAGDDDRWESVTYGNDLFVAVGTSVFGDDSVMTSPDGITWTVRSAAGDNDRWESVTYGDGLFVAVGGSGDDRVMTSPDGIIWTVRSAAGDNDIWYGVTYGNGLFVAVANSFFGGGDSVMTSPDGIDWTVRSATRDGDIWYDVTYANGLFVAVGEEVSMMSTDGIRWTQINMPGNNKYLTSVTYGNGVFVAVDYCEDGNLECAVYAPIAGLTTNILDNNTINDLTLSGVNKLNTPQNINISGDIVTGFSSVLGSDENGSVTLTGTNQSITGAENGTTTFNNFSKVTDVADTLTFGASSTYEFNGTLTLMGSTTASSTDSLTLVSSDPGSPWYINPRGLRQIDAVDVTDSYNKNQTTIVCYPDCTDGGGNTNWSFEAGAEIFFASEHNHYFYPGQGTTTLSDLSIVEGMDSAGITSANDIRISISTTSTDFRFDTGTTNLTLYGEAKDKVSPVVSYEDGGATLVLDVTSDFDLEDTLFIRGVRVGGFGSISSSTSQLELHIDGDSSGVPHTLDLYYMSITGAIFFNNHSNGQVADRYKATSLDDSTIFAFSIATGTEEVTIDKIVFDVVGATGLTADTLTNIKLYRDNNSDGAYDVGDTPVGGDGVYVKNGTNGTIAFTVGFIASDADYIVVADVAEVPVGGRATFALDAEGVLSTGSESESGAAIVVDVDVVTLSRQSVKSGGSRIGSVPVQSDPEQSGGDNDGGEIIDPNDGDELVLEANDVAPTTTGDPDDAWTNGANAYSSDGAYAETTGDGVFQAYGTFNISLPSGNEVTGVIVKLEASASTATGTVGVALSWDGGTTFTTPQETTVLATTDSVYQLGATNDDWGRSWTVSEFNNTNFRLRLIANTNSNTIRVDAVSVNPVHQETGGGSGGGGRI